MRIIKEYQKKIKINNKFYQLIVYQFYENSYLLVVRHSEGCREWILYVSERLMREFDCVTYGVGEMKGEERDLF